MPRETLASLSEDDSIWDQTTTTSQPSILDPEPIPPSPVRNSNPRYETVESTRDIDTENVIWEDQNEEDDDNDNDLQRPPPYNPHTPPPYNPQQQQQQRYEAQKKGYQRVYPPPRPPPYSQPTNDPWNYHQESKSSLYYPMGDEDESRYSEFEDVLSPLTPPPPTQPPDSTNNTNTNTTQWNNSEMEDDSSKAFEERMNKIQQLLRDEEEAAGGSDQEEEDSWSDDEFTSGSGSGSAHLGWSSEDEEQQQQQQQQPGKNSPADLQPSRHSLGEPLQLRDDKALQQQAEDPESANSATRNQQKEYAKAGRLATIYLYSGLFFVSLGVGCAIAAILLRDVGRS